MPPTISPTHALPLTQNTNHPTDINITTLILEIQSLCHARDYRNPLLPRHPLPHSPFSPSPYFYSSRSYLRDAAALQTLIKQKLDRLQHQILKRAIRKLEEQLDYGLLPENLQQRQQQIETDDADDEDDDGALLPVPLKIGSTKIRARKVRNDEKRNKKIEDENVDSLERLERKVLEVQIYTSD